MRKNAYHILSDLHFAWNLNARKNYGSEVLFVLEKLLDIADKYQEENYTNNLIVLGDLFNRGFSDPNEAMMALEMIRMVFSKFDNVYAVIGNHELTYYKNNPFWFLVSDIDDKRMLKLKDRMKQPKGINSMITVTDAITDGEVSFIFNHYGVPIRIPVLESKVNIGLFHQNIASHSMPLVWEKYIDIDTDKSLIGYDYLFCGHNHSNKYYGKYTLDNGSIAYFLAALARPNHTEVDDNFLERNIPVVCIHDGIFIGVEDNLIELPSRSETVIEEIIAANQKAREKTKLRKEIYETELTASTLFDLAKSNAQIAGVDSLLDLLLNPFAQLQEEYYMLLKEVDGDIRNE